MSQETEYRRLAREANDAQDKTDDVKAQIASIEANIKRKEDERDKAVKKIQKGYEDRHIKKAQQKLDDLELGAEENPDFDDIGKSEAASKAFAIRMVEVFEQRKKPSTALKVAKTVLGPAGAVLGDVGTHVVVVPAAAGVATGATLFVAGKAVVIVGSIFGGGLKAAAAGAIVSSPITITLAGIAVTGFAVWRGMKVVGKHVFEKKEDKKEPEKK